MYIIHWIEEILYYDNAIDFERLCMFVGVFVSLFVGVGLFVRMKIDGQLAVSIDFNNKAHFFFFFSQKLTDKKII